MRSYSQAAATGLLLCAAVLATSSCASQIPVTSPPGTATSRAGSQYPVVLDSVHLRLPELDYKSTDEQNQTIAAARITFIERCLRRFNVNFPKFPVPTGKDAYGPRSLTDRRYGIYDLTLATKFGYGLGPRDPALQAQRLDPSLSPDAQTALSGQGRSQINGQKVPEGGCLDEANRTLDARNPAGADPKLVQLLGSQSFEWSKKDPRVQAAVKAWSTCMAAHGYHYTDSAASGGDPRFSGSAGAATSRLAIDTATTDIGCKRQTNLVGIWFGIESDYQRDQINKQANAFKQALEALTARLDIARAALS